ncbi:MAG: CxxC-x17-CxxC domain-containing protein [Minisyncoccia bacterium]
MEYINFIGYTTFRQQYKKFGIKLDDRRRHVYIIGKTGMGKSELLKNMAIQDIVSGRGIAFLDPHGDIAQDLLDFVPKERIKDTIYFNPADLDFPISFNVMENVDPEKEHLIASGLMDVFKKIWPDVWSARMEYILYNTILALLEYPKSTLLGINRMLADPEYRAKIVGNLQDPVIKSFWVNEFSRYNQRYEVEATAAIQNKIGQFIATPLIRNIVGQEESTIDIRQIMDEGKILIVNLSKGKIGEDVSRLLGGLLVTKLQLAAMSRVNIPEEERKDFFLYVDEFQNFATESFANILSEARKYRLSLILAHQYIAQLEEKVRDAIFGNVGTIICFRIGSEDAEVLETEFSPTLKKEDLINLSKFNIYIKLMVDGITGVPFSAITLPPPKKPEKSFKEEIIKNTREKYGKFRQEVEEKIALWAGDYIIPKEKDKLYTAICSNCKKEIKVPFKPDLNKPVYCKDCLKKMGKNFITLEELLIQKPISFKKIKEEKKEKEKLKPDEEKLKEVLKDVLEKKENKEKLSTNLSLQKNFKKGKIEPGKEIKL